MGKRNVIACAACAGMLLFAFALLSAPALAAYKESVYKDWRSHNENFTVDNIFFLVKAGGSATKALITFQNNSVIVENGTCAEKLGMNLCLNSVKYPDENLHRLYNPEDYDYLVEVEFYLANLTIQRQIDKADLLVGEMARVEVTIQNEGSDKATDIYYRDSFPNFEVSNVVGCSFDSRNVTWSGILKTNERKICTYHIKAISPASFNSAASASYKTGPGSRSRTSSSAAVKLTVPEYEINVSPSSNASSLAAGDNFTYNLSLKSTLKDKSVDNVVVSVQIPSGVRLLRYSPEMSASGSLLKWNGKMEANGTKSLWAEFRAEYSGINTISAYTSYNIGNIIRNIAKNQTVNTAMDMLALQYISLKQEDYEGNSTKIVVNVNNPSSRYTFKNIKANVSTNLPVNFSASSFDSIGRKEFKNIATKDFALPHAEDITKYTIEFNVNYETEYGQKIALSESKTITVNPLAKKKTDSTAGITREVVSEKIEEIGVGKFVIGFTVFVGIFLFSSLYFLRKMVKKVQEFESYKNEKW